MKKHLILLAGMAMLPLLSNAQVSQIVSESEILAVTGGSDFRPSGLTVNSAGQIFVVDRAVAATNRVLKITPGTPNTVEVLVTGPQLVAAIEAVNGTTTMTAFNPRQLGIAADGDIVILGFSTGSTNAADSIVTVSNNVASPVINIVYTPVDDTPSLIDGSGALTVIGNTAYIANSTQNGIDNNIMTVGTNSGNTNPTVTLLGSAIESFYAGLSLTVVGNDAQVNAMTNDGTDLLCTISGTSTAPDDVLRVTTAGVITREVAATGIVSALTALDVTTTDIGLGSIALNGGVLFLSNAFGNGTYDEGILELSAITPPTAKVSTLSLTGAQIQAQIDATSAATISSIPAIASDSMEWDSANGRVVFANDFHQDDGIAVYVPQGSSVANWELHQ